MVKAYICRDCLFKLLQFWLREKKTVAVKVVSGEMLVGRLKAVLYNPRQHGPHSFTLALQKPDGAMVTIHGFLSAEVLDAPDKESLRRH